MSQFFRSAFGMSAAPAPVARLSESSTAVAYALASFRWHMDTRPPAKLIAIHDYLGSCASWQQLLNEPVADLPLSRLTPTHPLEVYCADMRGHNFSEASPLPPASTYVHACAADVLKLREDVLHCEAGLVGWGFGALVAGCAALHAPDAFSSLTLFVKDTRQLTRCEPSSYALREILRAAPRDAADTAALNAHLRGQLPHPAERAALLATAEVQKGRARFRFHNDLLRYETPLLLEAAANLQFAKPTTIYLYGHGACCAPTEEAALRTRFPTAKIVIVDAGGASLAACQLPVASLILQSSGLLSEIEDAAPVA